MVQRVKNIGAMSLATTMAVLYAALGLIAGAIIALISMAMPAAMGNSSMMFGMVGGVASIIVFPLIYGCIGFVAGLISAFVYNIVARMTGGVQLTLE
jgi:hypothetical protein